jgi:PAS domain S-box-containing protein
MTGTGPRTLEAISRSGKPVFATDSTERIVYWNAEAEKLLGYKADDVLGKFCYDILLGRDIFGNHYCQRDCAVSRQARRGTDDPVHPFSLVVRDADGRDRKLSVTMAMVPAVRASLVAVAHILSEEEDETAIPLARKLERDAGPAAELWPMETVGGRSADLTPREKQILGFLARGMTTKAIAEELKLSPATVRNHVRGILRKLDAHTKLAAVTLAFRYGLI